jgi:hypothetical protein
MKSKLPRALNVLSFSEIFRLSAWKHLDKWESFEDFFVFGSDACSPYSLRTKHGSVWCSLSKAGMFSVYTDVHGLHFSVVLDSRALKLCVMV